MNVAEAEIRLPVAEERAGTTGSLDLPEATQPLQIEWGYLVNVILIHALSLLIFVPAYFHWTGLLLAVVCFHIHGLLGITLCYHRVLTHQGLTLPKWLEHFFAILGTCCLQDTPARWVAVHRLHHRHSDQQPDPHSPRVNFFWAHVGWVFVLHRGHSRVNLYEQYARDILRDPFYLRLERKLTWLWIYWAHALVYFLLGMAGGWLWTGHWRSGLLAGGFVLVWGVFFRTIFVWHVTWAVNSVTHIIGYRNYETGDDSRNYWLVGVLAHGEGWHNNHHADQRAAAHGHRWWEIDTTWMVVRLLEVLGLAKNVVRPRVWRQKETGVAVRRQIILDESEPELAPLSEAHRS